MPDHSGTDKRKTGRSHSRIIAVVLFALVILMAVIATSVYCLFVDPDCVDVTIVGLNADARTVILIAEIDIEKRVTLPWCRKKVFSFTIQPHRYQQNVDTESSTPRCHEHVKWTKENVKRYGLVIYNSRDEAHLKWYPPEYISIHSVKKSVTAARAVSIDVNDGEGGELPTDFVP